MAPEDRDAVLDAVDGQRDPLVREVLRGLWLAGAFAAAWLALLTTGLAEHVVSALAGPVTFALLQLGRVLAMTSVLGRMELARRRAEALPPVAGDGTVPRGPTGRGPSGSKVALPGE